MKNIKFLAIICFILFSCGITDGNRKLSGIDEIGMVEFHKYKGYKVVDVYNNWDDTQMFILKNDTVRNIIVPRWFKELYHKKDTIK